MKKIVFLLVLLVFLGGAIEANAHTDRAYWHEEKPTTNFVEQYEDWMLTLSNGIRLSDISIPGTHDTMAFSKSLPVSYISRTQTMSLEDQLKSGIRFIDIRVSYAGSHFQLHHGMIDLGYKLEDVLNTLKAYLEKYPSETIIMRFKQEYTSASDEQMLELFMSYYKKYEQLFWNPYQSENRNNPLLEELRGKVCILSDVLSIQQGINYRNVNKQDNYYLPSQWSLYQKWEYIKQHIELSERTSEQIMINYLSGSGGVYPYFVASGHSTPSTNGTRLSTGLTEPAFADSYPDFPRIARLGRFATISFEGMNTLCANYLEQHIISRTGIIVADFPGERLVDSVIQCNYR